jgi:HSP20 family protein
LKKNSKSMRHTKRAAEDLAIMKSADLLLQRHDVWDRYAVGAWIPHVDICQTEDLVVVRTELPGVVPADIKITLQGATLRLQGVKREKRKARKMLSYICLERRFGKFDRSINIGWIVNPQKAHAYLDKGILTIQLPKLKDRRGAIMEIPINKK